MVIELIAPVVVTIAIVSVIATVVITIVTRQHITAVVVIIGMAAAVSAGSFSPPRALEC